MRPTPIIATEVQHLVVQIYVYGVLLHVFLYKQGFLVFVFLSEKHRIDRGSKQRVAIKRHCLQLFQP